jgi:hypothetical protein
MRRLAVVSQQRVGVEVKEYRRWWYEGEDPVVCGCCGFNRSINVPLKECGKSLFKNSHQQIGFPAFSVSEKAVTR